MLSPALSISIDNDRFPAKYKAIVRSRLNSTTNNFFSQCNGSKGFCKLVNNKVNYHWNKSVSCLRFTNANNLKLIAIHISHGIYVDNISHLGLSVGFCADKNVNRVLVCF